MQAGGLFDCTWQLACVAGSCGGRRRAVGWSPDIFLGVPVCASPRLSALVVPVCCERGLYPGRAVSVLAETVVEGNEATSLDSRSLPPTPARTMEPLTERTSSREGIMAFSVCSIRTVEEDSEPAEESEAAEESEVAEESAGTITRAEAAEGSDLLEATEFTGEMQALPRELLVHILGQHCACRDLSALAVCREWRFVAQDVYEAHARRRYPPATIAAAQRSGSFLPGNLKRGWRALLASDNAAGGLVDPLNHTIPRGSGSCS